MQSTLANLTIELDLQPGERLVLPQPLLDAVGPGRWRITVQPVPPVTPAPPVRQHGAFLNGYAPEDEGLYDDAPTR
jgi:hypothetical protein